MIRLKNYLIKSLIAILAVSFIGLIVGFTSSGRKVSADAATLDGVTTSTTKMLKSKDGNYLLLATAFSADDVIADTEHYYIIGYEIDGADTFNGTGNMYYESIRIKTSSEPETFATFDAADIFGEDYAEGYYLNVYEISGFDASKLYTVRPFIKQITPSEFVVGEYSVDKVA